MGTGAQGLATVVVSDMRNTPTIAESQSSNTSSTPAECAAGLGGAGCKACIKDVFSKACGVVCNELLNCSGNGRCRGAGNCHCDDGWSAADCSEPQITILAMGTVSVDAPALLTAAVLEQYDDDEAWELSGLDTWGSCGSYGRGGINHGWCAWDGACAHCRASCWQHCSRHALGNAPALSPTLLVVYTSAWSGEAVLEAHSAWDEASVGYDGVLPPFFLERAPLPGMLEVLGVNMGHDDWTPAFAIGLSAAETTRWLSHSSMLCKRGSGARGSMSGVVSVALSRGTVSDAYSTDLPALLHLRPHNTRATGAPRISVARCNCASKHRRHD
jgi:hypothetical protein